MSSIPIVHRGSYEHYKTRTKVFISWLTEAARTCCNLEDVVSALKGRAGKQARQNGEEILLTTREIIALCERIAAKKKATIPGWILALLKTIIDRRTAAAVQHCSSSAAEGGDLELSNVGHTYFIDVLQQAYDIFAAVDKSRITRRKQPAATPSPSKPLENMFKHLEVEDPSEIPLDEDELEQRAADLPRINFRVEVDDQQELFLKLMCLLGDFRQVRLEIQASFGQYARGEITYEVACMVASIGFGIIRRTCERFVDQHSEFGDYTYMLKFFGLRMERHEALVVLYPDGTVRDGRLPAKGASGPDLARPIVPFLISTSFLCASGADIMLRLREGLQSAEERQRIHCRPQQHHGFEQLLHEGTPELRKLQNCPSILVPELGNWYGDDFLSGILNFVSGEQQSLPIWLAVMTQCYRNIYDILGEDMQCGLETDSKKWERIRHQMDSAEAFEYCKGDGANIQRNDGWSPWFNWFSSRNTVRDGSPMVLVVGDVKGVDVPTHLMTHLPTVTAGMAFAPVLAHYMDGCSIASTNAIVHCAAHLYAACHYSGLVSRNRRWRDMDFFLQHNQMYTDIAADADPYTMVTHFQLALGGRRSTLAKARAAPGRVNIQNLRFITMSTMLMRKYAEALKRSCDSGKSMTGRNVMDGMLEALADCSKPDVGGKSSGRSGKVYTPVELLSVFKQHLIDDEPTRNFNMIGFSQQCSNFVSEIRTQASRVTQSASDAVSPPDLTLGILERSARFLDEGMPASATLLSVVSRVLEKTIADRDDKFSKEAYERSSGHIPTDQKPQLPRIEYQVRIKDARSFNSFLSICRKRNRNWDLEYSLCSGAAYDAHGSPDDFQRLAKIYDILCDWDWNWECTNKDPVDKMSTTLSFVQDMAAWGDADLSIEAMPADLVNRLVMGLESTVVAGSVERTRQWLAEVVSSFDNSAGGRPAGEATGQVLQINATVKG